MTEPAAAPAAIPADSKPRLPRGVRLTHNEAQGGWVLLAPERENDSALRDALTPLLGKIDIATMREANLRASGSQSAADVAKWLWEKINTRHAAR